MQRPSRIRDRLITELEAAAREQRRAASLSALALQLDCDNATLSHHLKQLVQSGRVARVYNPTLNRNVYRVAGVGQTA